MGGIHCEKFQSRLAASTENIAKLHSQGTKDSIYSPIIDIAIDVFGEEKSSIEVKYKMIWN